jgi:hypothetical protein
LGRCFATLFLLFGWMLCHLWLDTFGKLVVVVSFSRFRCLVVSRFGGFECVFLRQIVHRLHMYFVFCSDCRFNKCEVTDNRIQCCIFFT